MVTRIRQLLEEKQLTPTQFADLIGVGRPVVSHILSERNKPSLEVVQRVVEAFPEIALPWLLKGIGPMRAEEEASLSPTPPATPIEDANEPITPKNTAATAALTPPAQALPATPTPVLVAQSGSQILAAPPKAISASPPLASSAIAVTPLVVPRPLPGARFVPGAAKPSPYVAPVASPKETSEVPAPGAAATPSLNEATRPAQSSLEPSNIANPAIPAAGLLVPTHLPLPVETGKVIRRIVIFYRDGSFADYQPEA